MAKAESCDRSQKTWLLVPFASVTDSDLGQIPAISLVCQMGVINPAFVQDC